MKNQRSIILFTVLATAALILTILSIGWVVWSLLAYAFLGSLLTPWPTIFLLVNIASLLFFATKLREKQEAMVINHKESVLKALRKRSVELEGENRAAEARKERADKEQADIDKYKDEAEEEMLHNRKKAGFNTDPDHFDPHGIL